MVHCVVRKVVTFASIAAPTPEIFGTSLNYPVFHREKVHLTLQDVVLSISTGPFFLYIY